jgi:hypothetical protein
VANLAEAEGRVARLHIVRLMQGGVVFAVAGLLLAVGLVALAAAIFLGLRMVMPSWIALGLVALVPIALGGVGVVIGKGILER